MEPRGAGRTTFVWPRLVLESFPLEGAPGKEGKGIVQSDCKAGDIHLRTQGNNGAVAGESRFEGQTELAGLPDRWFDGCGWR